MNHYEAKLSECASLMEILERGRPRVVNNLDLFASGTAAHSKRIRRQGYQSSYTMPMYTNGIFFGFVFFNSYKGDVFKPEALQSIDLFGHLISLTIINEIAAIRTLLAAISTTRAMTSQRDAETGAHVNRMARYSRLIAKELADAHELKDDFIEHIFLFAPLHDIGKIGVPDSILLKPAKLTVEEKQIMMTHARKGRELIDSMLQSFGLDTFSHIEVLRNIVELHHEALDGSGYPRGLKGEEIPIEARIVAVADIFDALTSKRPYKDPWTNSEAFAAIRRLAGFTLDLECVEVLERCNEAVESIQEQFREEQF